MRKVIALLLVAVIAMTFVACSMGKDKDSMGNNTTTTNANNNAGGTNNETNGNNNSANNGNNTNGNNNNNTNTTRATENMLESMIPDVSTNVNTEGQR